MMAQPAAPAGDGAHMAQPASHGCLNQKSYGALAHFAAPNTGAVRRGCGRNHEEEAMSNCWEKLQDIAAGLACCQAGSPGELREALAAAVRIFEVPIGKEQTAVLFFAEEALATLDEMRGRAELIAALDDEPAPAEAAQ